MNAWRRVSTDRLVDPRLACHSPHDPPRGVTVEPIAFAAQEDRAFHALADRQVDRTRRPGREEDGDGLAEHRECAVAALETERFDVGAERFGHAQPVDRQQADERMLACRRQSGGDEQRADLVAVEAGGVGLVVEPRPTDVDGG